MKVKRPISYQLTIKQVVGEYCMKKLLLVVAAMSVLSSAWAAVGDTFKQGSVTYVVKSNNTVGIKSVDSKATDLQLESKIVEGSTMYTVVSVEEYAFRYSEAPSIVLPETVETIDYGGFYSCKSTSIALPSSLKTIGNYAFYACKNLTKIEIPEGVEEIGTSTNSSAFGTCYALKEVKFPSTLKKIWNSSFYHCGLESVTLPDNLVEISKNAFNQCDALTEVTMPKKLETIGVGAFGDCKKLTTIKNMPSSVKSIGEEAFFNCPLTEFTIPASCEEIGTRAFANSQISKFSVADGCKGYVMVGEALYSADKSLLVAFPPKSATTSVSVVDGCKGISGGAFQGSGVTSVTLPSSVIALDDFAFCQSSLTDIKLSDNIVYIGEQAFAGTNVTSMTVPNGVRYAYDATFAECKKLTSVTFGSNLKTMGIRQFYNCTALKEIHFTGSKAPEIDYWEYSSEAPFYGVPDKQVTVYVPKGLAAEYKDFKDYDAVSSITENATGIFAPASITPADKADVKTLDKLTFNFSEKATAVNRNPSIKVLCGSLVSGIPMGTEVKVGMWSILNDKSEAPYAVPLDEYGEDGMPVNMEDGKTYFVIVPAGTFKNESGDLNEEITLQYNGKWVEPQFMPVSVEPASGSELTKIENVYFTFESKPTKAYNCESKIKLIEGSLVDGVPVGKETLGDADEWIARLDGDKLQVFPGDMDYYLTPIVLEKNKEYFLVIGEKAVYNSDRVYNKQIVVKYTAKGSTGVDVVESEAYVVKNGDAIEVGVAGESTVQVYNASGVMVGSAVTADEATFSGLESGLYLVRISNANSVKTVKVMM